MGSTPRPDPFQVRELPTGLIPRPEIFEALKQLLLHNRGSQTAITAAITTALRGAGGFGKTTLALALCHDPDLWEAFPDGIIWLTLGETPPRPLDLVHSVLRTLDSTSQERSLPLLLDEARTALSRVLNERSCLLVLDDVWQAAHIADLLEGGSRCTRLITTRDDRVLPDTAERLFVDGMQEDEAINLLSRQLCLRYGGPYPYHQRKLMKHRIHKHTIGTTYQTVFA